MILCGDLNVAHHEIDLAHPSRNRSKSGLSHPQRDSFNNLLNQNYLDAFRLFESAGIHYTFRRFKKRHKREKHLLAN